MITWMVSTKVKGGKSHAMRHSGTVLKTACGQTHMYDNTRLATKDDNVCSKCLWLEDHPDYENCD